MIKNVKSAGQAGFTLIELIVVIVILGILGATALPKFIDVGSDARKAAVKGLAGSIQSAASMQYAKSGLTGTATYPTAATIANYVDVTGFTGTNGVYTLQANCSVTYVDAGTVTTDISGC